MRKILSIVLMVLFAVVANGESRRETTLRAFPSILNSNDLPEWILEEWSKAQDELLELDNLREDPRRFGPEEWSWMQTDRQFYNIDENGKRRIVLGATQYKSKKIIICCGYREIVRHEAFHAILWKMKDPRHKEHYPKLRRSSENILSRLGKILW